MSACIALATGRPLREAQMIPLAQAQLCQDCDWISAAANGRCEKCGSGALLGLASVLNRIPPSL